MPAGCAFHAIIPPLPRQFWPQVFISKHSYDTHRLDLLARIGASTCDAAHAAGHTSPNRHVEEAARRAHELLPAKSRFRALGTFGPCRGE